MTKLRIKLNYEEELIKEPILSEMVKKFNVDFNVRRADINEAGGWVIIEMIGNADNVDQAIEWLNKLGVGISILGTELE
jgi:ABC-type methionine transport system ATPase subunit